MLGVPVVTCLRAFFSLHARLRVRETPGIPCALLLVWGVMTGKARADHAARMRTRVLVVIASEAKQSIQQYDGKLQGWIAASRYAFLAMTD